MNFYTYLAYKNAVIIEFNECISFCNKPVLKLCKQLILYSAAFIRVKM